jgi:hypothetical protein
MPSGFDGTMDIYTIYIPVPIFSIIAAISYRLLSPTRILDPWTDESEGEPSEFARESNCLG